jgi:prefoldin subunit 5
VEQHSTPAEQPASNPSSAPVAPPPKPLEAARSIGHGLALLKAEQCERLEKKANDLHGKVKGLHEKINNIDKLLSNISKYSQKNADGTENTNGTIDCKIPEIATLVETLRRDNISVPLPDGTLQKGERGNVVNVLSNQRSLLSDEQREHSQEFQQCAVERNSLFQGLMSLISELHRVLSKIIGNISSRASS